MASPNEPRPEPRSCLGAASVYSRPRSPTGYFSLGGPTFIDFVPCCALIQINGTAYLPALQATRRNSASRSNQSVSAGSELNSHLCSRGRLLTASSRRASSSSRPIHRSFWIRRAQSRGNGCAWRVISFDRKSTRPSLAFCFTLFSKSCPI